MKYETQLIKISLKLLLRISANEILNDSVDLEIRKNRGIFYITICA